MAYSNRRSHRPDPTIAPVILNPATGEFELRTPFTPSAYTERKFLESAEGRRRARNKGRLTTRYGRG